MSTDRLSTKSKTIGDTEAVVDDELVDGHDGSCNDGHDVKEKEADGR
jgi:hypothetical protein